MTNPKLFRRKGLGVIISKLRDTEPSGTYLVIHKGMNIKDDPFKK